MLNDECKTEFRFEKTHLPLLADVLQIPPMFKCSQGSVADGMETLCMLLKRLSYPCRYEDMVPRFDRPIPVLSMVTNQVLESRSSQPKITGTIHLRCIQKRGSTRQLVWFCRWNRETNFTAGRKPEGSL